MKIYNLFPKTLFTSLLFGIILSFSGCMDVPPGTPCCIIDRIKKTHCLENVYRYDYNGQKVYFFTPSNCPDAECYILFDENCNMICSFGYACSTGSCADFYQTRTNEKLIWQK